MTPTASLLLELAGMVSAAERQFTNGPLYWARSKVEEVTQRLEGGQPLNILGELQGTAAGFDAAVVRLETAAQAFKVAYCAIGPKAFPGWADDEVDWLDRVTDRSPRLQAIIAEVDGK